MQVSPAFPLCSCTEVSTRLLGRTENWKFYMCFFSSPSFFIPPALPPLSLSLTPPSLISLGAGMEPRPFLLQPALSLPLSCSPPYPPPQCPLLKQSHQISPTFVSLLTREKVWKNVWKLSVETEALGCALFLKYGLHWITGPLPHQRFRLPFLVATLASGTAVLLLRATVHST